MSDKPFTGAISIIKSEESEKELRRLAKVGKRLLKDNRNDYQRKLRRRKKNEAEEAEALAGTSGGPDAPKVTRAWIELKLKKEAEDPESKPTDRIAALDKLARAHGMYSENSGASFMLNINILDPTGQPTQIVHSPRDITPEQEQEEQDDQSEL